MEKAEADRRAREDAELKKRRADQAKADRVAKEEREKEQEMLALGKVPLQRRMGFNGPTAAKKGSTRVPLFVASANDKGWFITNTKYDVKKSDSLVSPYIATIFYKTCKKHLADNPYGWIEHIDTFGWQNQRWVLTQRQFRLPFANSQFTDKSLDRPTLWRLF